MANVPLWGWRSRHGDGNGEETTITGCHADRAGMCAFAQLSYCMPGTWLSTQTGE